MPQQVATVESSANWYRPGKSIAEFHEAKARTRVMVGARGCGKTTALAVEAIGHGWHNPGGKIYILRKTQESNEATTLDTFEEVFRNCGNAYIDTGLSLFKKIEGGKFFRIPSAEAVRLYNVFLASKPNKSEILQWLDTVGLRYCSFIHFAGVPHAGQRDTRFRGYECSMLIFVEADQLTEEDYLMALMCLRWKNAHGAYIEDYSCILDTNPPGTRHWIAQQEETAIKQNRKDIRFWHIPMEENAHNLRPGYVEEAKAAYAKKPALYKRMVLGQYADTFDGDPVLWAFSEEHAYDGLPWPRGAYLVRGWDFGTSQAVIFAAYWEEGGDEYWWDLHEHYATQSDVEKQCRAAWDITRAVFPFYNDRSVCSGVLDACDPAGNSRTDKGRSLDVLATHGVYPKFSLKHRSLQLTLAAYNRLLEHKDKHGRLVYRVCRKGCPMLYSASCGGYRYPQVSEHGYGSGEPGKGPDFGDFDHVADASRYAKVNFLRLMRVEMDKLVKPVGKLAAKTAVNPPRTWR
jgi:hypothetical protein